jgi:ribosome-binding protein aMBF1 (putative translation factor)
MEACIFCGNPNNLIEAVGEKEIILVCEVCAYRYNMPVVRKPSAEQLKNTYRVPRLNAEEPVVKNKDPETLRLEKELKDIVKKNVAKDYSNLIDNFHWTVQQKRRHKKLSVKQLAEAIAEPEFLVEMVEKGQLPENYDKLITKLEQFLRVKLSKVENVKQDSSLDIKKIDPNEVTIGDLKELNEKKKKGILRELFRKRKKTETKEVSENIEAEKERVQDMEEVSEKAKVK